MTGGNPLRKEELQGFLNLHRQSETLICNSSPPVRMRLAMVCCMRSEMIFRSVTLISDMVCMHFRLYADKDPAFLKNGLKTRARPFTDVTTFLELSSTCVKTSKASKASTGLWMITTRMRKEEQRQIMCCLRGTKISHTNLTFSALSASALTTRT